MADNGHANYTGLQELLAKGHRPSGPWRGYKGQIGEGGHRIPFVARWPGKIKPNTSTGQTVCLGDMLATAAAMVGAKLPANVGEDSYDILPAMTGTARGPVREYTVHDNGYEQFAIRQGPWKLIPAGQPARIWSTNPGVTPGELYKLEDDPGEEQNLVESHPEIVKRLSALLDKCKREGRSRA